MGATSLNLAKGALQVLQAVAPTVATALGGPLAGSAVTFLENWITGAGKVSATATTVEKQAAIEQALLGGDPQTMLALKKLETDFNTHMADLGVQQEQLAYQDTASARAREVAVRDWTPRLIGFAVVGAAFALEGCLLLGWHYPTKVSGEVLGRILGTLDSATLLVLSYYFGSSAGARQSAETLGEIAKQP